MGLVLNVEGAHNKWSLKNEHVMSFKVLKHQIFLNSKNAQKINKQHLKSDPYVELLVSTNRGLKTYTECLIEKIGGVVRVIVRADRVVR